MTDSCYNKEKSLLALENVCSEFYMVEPWRFFNPTEKRFSWYKCKPKLCASRIDFSLISQGLHSDHLA